MLPPAQVVPSPWQATPPGTTIKNDYTIKPSASTPAPNHPSCANPTSPPSPGGATQTPLRIRLTPLPPTHCAEIRMSVRRPSRRTRIVRIYEIGNRFHDAYELVAEG